MTTLCNVPGCGKPAPVRSAFCPDCYFRIPRYYTRLIDRTMFACSRVDSDDELVHLRQQLRGYISVAVASLSGGNHAA